jgi:hypothetical protein
MRGIRVIRFFSLALPLAASLSGNWELQHPDQLVPYVARWVDNSGTLVLARNQMAVVDWETRQIRYHEDWAGTTDRWTFRTFGENGAYRVIDRQYFRSEQKEDLFQERTFLEPFRIELPPLKSSPVGIVACNDSGNYLLIKDKVFQYFPEDRSLQLTYPLDRPVLALAGGDPPDLFAVLADIRGNRYHYSLEQLQNGTFLKVADLGTSAFQATYGNNQRRTPERFQLHALADTVYIQSGNDLQVLDLGSGELTTLEGVGRGAILPDGKGTVLFYNRSRPGYMNIEDGIFHPLEGVGRIQDATYNHESGDWFFAYNRHAVAKTTDFKSFARVNPAAFDGRIHGLTALDKNLLVFTVSGLFLWNPIDGWRPASDGRVGIRATSIARDGERFFLGNEDKLIVLEDLRRATHIKEDLLTLRGPEGVTYRREEVHVARKSDSIWAFVTFTASRSDSCLRLIKKEADDSWIKIGDWPMARRGLSGSDDSIVLYNAHSVIRVATKTHSVEEIPLPEDTGLYIQPYGDSMPLAAARGDEILILTPAARNMRLMRYRTGADWEYLPEILKGQCWHFTGVTDRYHLLSNCPDWERKNFPARTGMFTAETIHGDAIKYMNGPSILQSVVRLGQTDYANGDFNGLWARHYTPLELAFPNNQELSGGWWMQDQLGRIYMAEFPWVYTETYGWWRLESTGPGEWLMHDEKLGWIWTTPEFYPSFYQLAFQKWYQMATTNAVRQWVEKSEAPPPVILPDKEPAKIRRSVVPPGMRFPRHNPFRYRQTAD